MAKEKLELREGEELLLESKGDTWRDPDSMMNSQVSGRFYFTNQRIAFRTWGPLKKAMAYDIEYKDIAGTKNYMINFFIPTGIKIDMKEGKGYKISLLKRSKYVNIIHEHI